MFTPTSAFSGFSVDDMAKAKEFYTKTLELVVEDQMGDMGTKVNLPGGGSVWMYTKDNHQPASYTVLNFVVKDIDEAVEALTKRGVKFEHYPGFAHDNKGIVRGITAKMGPDIAWFKDPAGNVIAVLQES